MSKILVVEDEQAIRTVLVNIISDEYKDHQVMAAEDGEKAISILKKESFDLVICDIKMPKKDGIQVLETTLKEEEYVPFIMISGHGDIDTAVECIKKGAFDYISKPPDLNRLLTTIKVALDQKNLVVENKLLTKENKLLKNKIKESKYEMIGDSTSILEVKKMIEKVAPTEARVLVTGPNGAGKELVAHWIHDKSDRSKKQIIEVNCAAIPSELIESELFGHVKGSFTGAHKDKEGKFELANKGTLFLDEIGDMNLAAQAKVLRALQEKKISRVGADKEISVDVRVIAATNKDLREEISAGRFREDLYHRLAVIVIQVPSLNDRREDIGNLVTHFVDKLSNSDGLPFKTFEKGAIAKLEKHDWTGNIRELRNVVERLLILVDGTKVTATDVNSYVVIKGQ